MASAMSIRRINWLNRVRVLQLRQAPRYSTTATEKKDEQLILPQPRQIRRFWKKVTVQPANHGKGFIVLLDGRMLKTPQKQPFILPSKMLTLLVAGEWEAQKEFLESHTMSLTTLASAAIDGPHLENRSHDQVVDQIMSYLKTDTVCFPHEYPADLANRERKFWTPLVQWVETKYDVKLTINRGNNLLFAPQPPETIQKLRQVVAQLGPWELIGFEHAVRASKSVVIALALLNRQVSVDFGSDASRVEVLSQVAAWGEVQDTHDIDEQDIRVRLGAAVVFIRSLQK